MPISALTALAAPAAGIAAVKLAQHVSENRPFANLLAGARQPDEAARGEDAPSTPPLEQRVDTFAALVRERLQAAGVNTSISFQLTLDGDGRLRVAGTHPRKAQIERALAGADDLAAAFAQLAQAQGGTSSEYDGQAFAQSYIDAAVNRPSDLHRGPAKQFAVEINGDEASIVA